MGGVDAFVCFMMVCVCIVVVSVLRHTDGKCQVSGEMQYSIIVSSASYIPATEELNMS